MTVSTIDFMCSFFSVGEHLEALPDFLLNSCSTGFSSGNTKLIKCNCRSFLDSVAFGLDLKCRAPHHWEKRTSPLHWHTAKISWKTPMYVPKSALITLLYLHWFPRDLESLFF